MSDPPRLTRIVRHDTPYETEQAIAEAVRDAWAFIGRQECSCAEDADAVCWYHRSDEERIAMATQHAVSQWHDRHD